ncbi:ABC transporter permease [Acidobacteria bacterium AB60]|nr:ABC transporter permease [Acidobacteria bacterium AB60]
MMLLYKAWLESRARFLLGLLALAGLSAVFVLFNQDVRTVVTDHDMSYVEYIWRGIFKGQLRDIYVILTLLLGLGGLDRERSYGTAGHTLALPVSRWRLIAARGLTGIVETAVLAILPASLVPALSPFVHESYSWLLAFQFGALWTIGGTLIFAIGFLASVLVAGEYSAAVAALVFLFGYSITTDLPGMEHYLVDIHDVMNGSGPHDISTLAAISVTAAAMIWFGGLITSRKDY